ncbi:MAG: LysM peptidoglycan-binding domain-containing protein [Candidatus Eiseniibacteriota bacterium]
MTRPVPRRAAAGGTARMSRSGLLALGAGFLLSGCFATEKHVEMIETDLTQKSAWTDERIQRVESDLEALRSENEALRLRIDDLSDQMANLGGEVSTRLSELVQSDQDVAEQARMASQSATDLETKRQRDREEMLERMNVILEEVLKENERLAGRVEKLESSALTFGKVHRVQPGESVAGIAARYGVTADDIVAANGLSDANVISVGQELIIPSGSQ